MSSSIVPGSGEVSTPDSFVPTTGISPITTENARTLGYSSKDTISRASSEGSVTKVPTSRISSTNLDDDLDTIATSITTLEKEQAAESGNVAGDVKGASEAGGGKKG